MSENYIQIKSRVSKAKFVDHVRIITSAHVSILFFYGQGREWIRDYEYVNIFIPKTEPKDRFLLQFTNTPDPGSYKLVGRQRSSPFIGFRKAKRILGIDDGRYRCEYDPDKKQCVVYINERLDMEVY